MNHNSPFEQEPFQYPESGSQAVSVRDPSPLPKKPGRRLLFAGVAAVCIVAAAVGIKLAASKSPKAVVETAIAKTFAAQKAANQKYYNKIPALRPIFEGRRDAHLTEFDLTVKAIEDTPYATLASIILKDAGIRGQISNNPADNTTAFEGSVYLRDATLAAINLYTSPEIVAGNLPTFSDTVVAFNPNTLTQDYPSSALNSRMPLSYEQVAMLQGLITGGIEYIGVMGNLSSEALLADITPIFKNALKNAEYSYDTPNNVYLVNIPQGNLKTAITDYYRYLYFESEFSPAMEKMLTPILAAETGSSYEQAMNETLATMADSIQDMSTTITLVIDGGLIKSAQLSCLPTQSASPEEAAIELMTFDYTIAAELTTAKYRIELIDTSGQKQIIVLNTTGGMVDDAYTLDMVLGFTNGSTNLSMPLSVRVAADGSYACKANILAGLEGGIGFDCKGTVDYKEGVLRYSLPGSCVYAVFPELSSASATLVFDLNSSSSPLTGPVAAPEPRVSLLEMDAQQLSRLSREYAVGTETLIGRLYSLLMS